MSAGDPNDLNLMGRTRNFQREHDQGQRSGAGLRPLRGSAGLAGYLVLRLAWRGLTGLAWPGWSLRRWAERGAAEPVSPARGKPPVPQHAVGVTFASVNFQLCWTSLREAMQGGCAVEDKVIFDWTRPAE